MDKKEKEQLLKELKFYKEAYKDLRLIFDTTFDHISVADEKGVFLRVSRGTLENFGVSKDKIIGVSSSQVEKMGIINKSMTEVVLKTRQKETAVQETCTGKKFVVIGNPAFDEFGNLERIINISRDITQMEKLKFKVEETEELLNWYKNELQNKKEVDDKFILGSSMEMKEIMALIHQTSDVDATMLLEGETGVGKSFIAKTIHKLSNRREKPFIQINCGAIPENLLESELFGYEKDSFTGASKSGKKGFFEVANHGTIFLDEIGEIPLHLQVKILHALEEKEIYRVGGTNLVKIDVRILAATNKNLKQMVEDGNFRKDLYYRLNILPIEIPPLRKRSEDIPILAYSFLQKFNKKYSTNKKITSKTYNILSSYAWPGNIRELENVIERLLITCEQESIEPYHIYNILGKFNEVRNIEVKGIIPLKEAKTEVEIQLLSRALKEYKTTRKIAEVLGIHQSTVVKKLQKLRQE